jgi:pilus assembly protein CpaD
MTSRTFGPGRPILAASGLALLVAGGLAGCATPPSQPLQPERTTEAPNAIEVTTTHRTLAVHFDPGRQDPRVQDIAALNVLLATGDVVPGDLVRIERAASPLAELRARGLAAALARQGLKPTLGAPGGAPEGELHLIVDHAVATVPACPNWTKPPGNDFDNTMHSDYGCASAVDLAAMVADPRDLVEGRPLAPVVGDVAIFAINRYRTGMPANANGIAAQPFADATTDMATAPPAGAKATSDHPPSGAAQGGGGAAAEAVSAAGLAGGYAAPSQAPQ